LKNGHKKEGGSIIELFIASSSVEGGIVFERTTYPGTEIIVMHNNVRCDIFNEHMNVKQLKYGKV
jgi:hypothetical protein